MPTTNTPQPKPRPLPTYPKEATLHSFMPTLASQPVSHRHSRRGASFSPAPHFYSPFVFVSHTRWSDRHSSRVSRNIMSPQTFTFSGLPPRSEPRQASVRSL
ncbi:hypothetical protein E2C01_033889 [Portunus trituberculatus]|uniref:Uncharacterized protein n=1 Tax=Portunus trituberculatus TaxID=210409 RepID=A0A5B7F5F9_PORTR|nr:hypothetical protein [Portunus trituberculatus]